MGQGRDNQERESISYRNLLMNEEKTGQLKELVKVPRSRGQPGVEQQEKNTDAEVMGYYTHACTRSVQWYVHAQLYVRFSIYCMLTVDVHKKASNYAKSTIRSTHCNWSSMHVANTCGRVG